MKKHFEPDRGWMNDPNGTIVINDSYHLFYQHYPDDIKWGPMHWGHAVSKDGINWEHKKIALFPDESGYIFSGSCVLDTENVSGFGDGIVAALLAFYTCHDPHTEEQQQCIAYSLDYENFTPYAGNPIISNKKTMPCFKKDFRDPNVFDNPILGGYSMILAAGTAIEFYHSLNLKDWEKTGAFDIGSVGLKGICECPDCFFIQGKKCDKWVLTFSLCGNDTPNIMPYFFGEFDGRGFIPDSFDDILLLDYALDNYASVTFRAASDCTMIGWGECWSYAQDTPASLKRGKMTCIKKVSLLEVNGSLRLSFSPLKEYKPASYKVAVGNTLSFTGKNGGLLSVTINENTITVDRTKAVTTRFHDCFDNSVYSVFSAKRTLKGDCELLVVEDDGFFEIFADCGTVLFSVNTY